MGVRQRRPVALHVLTRLILGGPIRPVLDTCCLLAGLGYRPVLAVGSAATEEVRRDDLLECYPDLPVLQIAALVREPSPLKDLRALSVLTAATRRLEPAVVHTHTAKAGTVGRLGAVLARRRGVRLVHTFHGHSLSRSVSGAMAPAWTVVERLLATRATDLVLTLSPGQAEEIGGRLGRSAAARIAVVPLGVELSREPPSRSASERLREHRVAGGVLAGFVGRGVPAKGLEDLAAAHARLETVDPAAAARLRVVLIGPVEQRLQQRVGAILAGAGIAERWLWLGPVFEAQSLMRELDALVLPSRSEGTPVSVIEALGQGIPILASRVGGVGEMLERSWERIGPGRWRTSPCEPRGLALPAADVEAWARALQSVVETGARGIPGDPAERRRFAESVFDPARRAFDLATLYRRIGAPRGTGPEERLAEQGPRPPGPRGRRQTRAEL